MSFEADQFETSDWKLIQARNFLSELLGLPIEHFSIAFRCQNGTVGVVATSPMAIQELDAKDIQSRAAQGMLDQGKRIIRKEVDIGKLLTEV